MTKLYIEYSKRDNYQTYGTGPYCDWSNEIEFQIHSVRLQNVGLDQSRDYEIAATFEDVKVGDTVHVLVVRYSDGNSFGFSTGDAEIVWVFTDAQFAIDAVKKILDQSRDSNFVFMDGDREITLRSPCCGYFERFESVDVFSFVVEP